MSTFSQFGDEDIGEHVSEAELSSVLKQCLAPAQTVRLAQHLPRCQACRDLIQDANDFCQPRHPDEYTVNQVQIQAGWDRLKTRLLQSEPSFSSTDAQPSAVAASATTSRRWILPLAAMLFLSLTITSAIFWRERQTAVAPTKVTIKSPEVTHQPALEPSTQSSKQVRTVSSPISNPKPTSSQANTGATAKYQSLAIYDVTTLVLSSGERSLAGAPPLQLPPIPARTEQLRFKFRRYKPTEFNSYQVELLNEIGNVKQIVQGALTKNKQDSLIEAIFSREGLTDGDYQFRVTGQGREEADLTPLTTSLIKLSFQIQ